MKKKTIRLLALSGGALVILLSAMLGHTQTAKDSEAKEEKIQSAMSAGPASISAKATVLDWDMSVLRKGTNEWTCLPDRPDTPGNDPWCMNEPWLNFLSAYMKKEKPTYTQIGFAYMLMGDAPVSNTDPYATQPTATNEWVEHTGPHIMMLVPDKELLKTMTKDHKNGGPFVMWAGTPYEHVMIPLEEEHHK
jgi:hypothetical protein